MHGNDPPPPPSAPSLILLSRFNVKQDALHDAMLVRHFLPVGADRERGLGRGCCGSIVLRFNESYRQPSRLRDQARIWNRRVSA